jgi:hypothetical protein
MAYTNKFRTGMDILLTKTEQKMFVEVWVELSSLPTLTKVEKELLAQWDLHFIKGGKNWKPLSKPYTDFLDLAERYGIHLQREQRPGQAGSAELVDYVTPVHQDGMIRGGSYWPKKRDKKRPRLSFEDLCSEWRQQCKAEAVEKNRKTRPERNAILLMQVELAELRKAIPILTARINELQQTLHDLTDDVDAEVEKIKLTVDHPRLAARQRVYSATREMQS